MAVFKATLLFKLATNVALPSNPARRIGGWSESWYYNGGTVDQLKNLLLNPPCLASVRAALLPTGASIIGARIQSVDPVGSTQIFRNTYPGSSGLLSDVPQMALLYSMGGVGVRNTRLVTLRGIPDTMIVQGEYSPTFAFEAARKTFNDTLSFFNFRGKDLSAPQFNILTISALGLVQTLLPHGYNVNQLVRVLRVTTSPGNTSVGGRYAVDSIGPSTSQFTLRNWTAGLSNGGTVQLAGAVIYPTCDGANAGTASAAVRKVGRPFDLYRGRHSKR